MQLKYKEQKFQENAANAVCDVFVGQPFTARQYRRDMGLSDANALFQADSSYDLGWKNAPIVLSDDKVLENLRKVQKNNELAPSPKLEGRFNLTIEMETGVGKTYTYIKTIYELNKRFGWLKFIVVVPSVAIREGVYKSFDSTGEHFSTKYGKKIHFFIYNSAKLTELDKFASSAGIEVMIVNSQAFNAKGADARRIRMELDEFQSRRPIDVVAATNPILIIDEPQSVEGKQTKESLKDFNPLFTLRYSATHRADSIYNMVYRLDALDAYNQKLVKKIAVKGIAEKGFTGTNGFLYLESINLSSGAPTATLQFDSKGKSGLKRMRSVAGNGFSIYAHSGELDEYKNGYTIASIDGRTGEVELINGIRLRQGEIVGHANEEQFRRIQIRETILSHIERERKLFKRGIKVLSLFFIDEVAKYRQYENGEAVDGVYARIFDEEYRDVLANLQREFDDAAYMEYLKAIPVERTRSGYFSIDKKGNMVDGKIDRKEGASADVDAYDLIMKNKELLLDRDPERSPVRFIFSHSALREGWDNPNVFQICALKQSGSDVRRRQEVGRGLRLCVNQLGERMDADKLSGEVHDVNRLTIIASESYEQFVRALQTEIAEAIGDRPRKVTVDLFKGKVVHTTEGFVKTIDADLAQEIVITLAFGGYIDQKGGIKEKLVEDLKNNEVKLPDSVADCAEDVLRLIQSVYDPRALVPENAREANVEPKVDNVKLASKEFKELWNRINQKTYYLVDFEDDEITRLAIVKLDAELRVVRPTFTVTEGEMNEIRSKEALVNGSAFEKTRQKAPEMGGVGRSNGAEYDLVGRIAEETKLLRKTIVAILQGVRPDTFELFNVNPEDFIIQASRLINDVKATTIVEHITYRLFDDWEAKYLRKVDRDELEKRYSDDVFTEPSLKGKMGENALATPKKHLYDWLIYDSDREKKFAETLEIADEVVVYAKLPRGFYIDTPVGKYNPDWAIAFREGSVKHIYFVAETKGSMDTLALRPLEQCKIECARKHFAALGSENIKYDVVDSYDKLLEILGRAAT